LLPSLATSISNVALPDMARAFDATFQQAQWIVIAYLLVVTALIVSVGRVGDMVGRRRLLLAGVSVFTVASLLCGMSPTLSLLVAARVAQGLGAAIMMALAMALVGETVAKAKTGSAMGMLGTMSAVGTALGPSLGGALVSAFGWESIFLFMAPVGILAFLLASRHLPADRPEPTAERGGFDKLGTLLLAGTLAAYALAMTTGRGTFGPLNLALLLAAASGACLFVRVEAKASAPLIGPAAFRNAALSAGLMMNVLVSAVMMATLVVGPFYLSRALGLDAAFVGAVMSAGPVISALSGVPAGRLVDRLGAPLMIIVGLVAMSAGSIGLSTLPDLLGIAGYIGAIAILTPGYELFLAANNTTIMMDVPADQRGVVSGLLNLSRNLGLVTGAAALGAVFAFASAAIDISTASPAAIAIGMRTTFAVAAGLIVVALAVAVAAHAASRHGPKR
jgi:MFS family permease